jgi:photosystem II stability/assembly factor-like uncharacterized protein
MRLVAANPAAPIEGLDQLSGKINYAVGNDHKQWRASIPAYSRVLQKDVYPGIDLVYYGNRGQLEYDFIVAPGGNPRRIEFTFEGAKRMRIDKNGDLAIKVKGGEVRQRRPVVYQEVNGFKLALCARYVLRGKHRAAIRLGKYDASRPVIIDPVLSYSTYLGGGSDKGVSIAVDSSGNAYVVGETRATDFPVTPGTYRSGGGNYGRVFISKMNPAGDALVYSTYFGGTGGDFAAGVAVDASGNAFITGYTFSTDFPTTEGAFQPNRTAPVPLADAFVTKLNPSGSSLVYSTYLGGGGNDSATAIDVDSSGNAYVTGGTFSDDFPATPGAFISTYSFQAGYGVMNGTAFVTKLNATGSSLAYSTFLGSPDGQTSGLGIAVDSEGHAFVAGRTSSANFPTTPGAFQTVSNRLPGPLESSVVLDDGFVAKLNSQGSGLVYSTLLGGRDGDLVRSIAVDSTGNAYVAGYTFSANFPVATPLQTRLANGPLTTSTDGGGTWGFNYTGIWGSETRILTIDPRNSATVYAYTTRELFKSLDRGDNWSLLSQPDTYVNSLKIDPRTSDLYIGSEHGAFKSTDGGGTWSSVGLQGRVSIWAIHPQTSTVYATGPHPDGFYQLYKSTDGGKGWSPLDAGLSHTYFMAVALDPTTPSVIHAGISSRGRSGLGWSSDGGSSWNFNDLTEADVFSIAVDPQNTLTVYASIGIDPSGQSLAGGDGRRNPRRRVIVDSAVKLNGRSLVKSTDGGRSWRPINDGLQEFREPNVIAIDQQTPTTLYAGTGRGVAKSTDGGESWTYIDAAINTPINALAIDALNPSKLYVGCYTLKDAFLAKLNPTGASLIYSTFIGGNGSDQGIVVKADAAGNAYFGGATSSADLPISSGAFQTSLKTDPTDPTYRSTGFVIKLDASGALLYSTYFGGSVNESINGLAVDSAGNVYLAGTTGSPDFPTARPLQAVLAAGSGLSQNAFVAKLTGSLLVKGSAPRITGVRVSGKKLIVDGENFSPAAVVLVGEKEQKTVNDSQLPVARLVCKKAGKGLKQGESAMIRVRNADGEISPEYVYMRPVE